VSARDVVASGAADPRETGPFVWRRDDGAEVSTDDARLDVDMVHRFLATSYWAPGMPRVVLERGLRHSLNFGLYLADGSQVGFARTITDRATFAYLSDVFVLEAQRGRGLGKFLVACITECPALQGLRRFALLTRDAQTLYSPFGFGPFSGASTYMEIRDPRTNERARDEAGWPV
jgi:N-acetylglutamate synthase-like GNAT family acetyltransferase